MTFGLMLHHFAGEADTNTPPGALSGCEFRKLITYLGDNHTILSPKEYERRALRGDLGPDDVCLTFDDALKSQIDVAAPILDEFELKAFFFVYSGAFEDNPPLMEFARDFRSGFSSTAEYYAKFFDTLKRETPGDFHRLMSEYPEDYLREYSIYSRDDRRYRFARDHILKDGYDDMVLSMMHSYGYDVEARRADVFMSNQDLSRLVASGHTLGLHSTSHPMQMQRLGHDRQKREFENNLSHLKEIVNEPITSMSHPCGNYGSDTLEILQDMGVRIGFRSSMTRSETDTSLEIPREDHAVMFRRVSTPELVDETI